MLRGVDAGVDAGGGYLRFQPVERYQRVPIVH